MAKRTIGFCMFLCVSLWSAACGGGNSAQEPAQNSTPAAQPANRAAVPAPAKTGFEKIGDIFDAWNGLYNQNEAAINDYEGMPILELVTPATTFIGSIQFDFLNMDNRDGRFEGKLPLAGYVGFVEKAGSKIRFGYDRILEEDGFGPLAKAGDHAVENGALDLVQEYYRVENFTERGGKRISRGYGEFKRLGDGSMICLTFDGHAINARGEEVSDDSVIYLHNGNNRYDFVVGKGKTGPQFQFISFADKGDLRKEQAIELFKATGYTIDKSGGIKDGKLIIDE